MLLPTFSNSSAVEPIRRLAEEDQEGVIAIIVRIEGPPYRPLGAMMAVFEDESRVGTLSSGCIEADIAHHAVDALSNNRVKSVVYGRGSPFLDIQLPCGGGLEVFACTTPEPNSFMRDH